jgi:hypothetical protein
MRLMVIVKATPESEAGELLSEQTLARMMKYNEELAKAGVLLAAEKLQPSSQGVRVQFSGSQRLVTDGPFAESKELLGGFAVWQVKSKEEAVEWLKRAPFEAAEIELRPLCEAEDFGAALTPEIRDQVERLCVQMAANQSSVVGGDNA